jgi:acyl-CoA thioesterase-2
MPDQAAKAVPLIETLRLKPVEANMFQGFSPDQGFNHGRIFGGQVIAQALLAAYCTVEDRICHSLHAYFIRPGDPKIPVLYQVERARDGKSFTTRRVVAIQHGEQILNLSASFQVSEPGLEHQSRMPAVPPPEELADERALRATAGANMSQEMLENFMRERPIEMRPVSPRIWSDPTPREPVQRSWFRANGDFGDDVALNQAVLAYASDMSLLSTSNLPHGVNWTTGKLQSASLDHILWFHRPSNMNEWHLYDQDSPSASGARGFNRGAIYRQDGVLVASAAQEGLMRVRP